MKQLLSSRQGMNLGIAWEALQANRVRSMLTALGIIFGVAAVITMLAIGKGAQQEILSQLELVGVNNIEIKPIIEQKDQKLGEEQSDEIGVKFSKGLDLRDAYGLQQILPGLRNMSPEVILNTSVISNGRRRSAKLIGVWPSFFEVFNIQLQSGQLFSQVQMETAAAVCVVGSGIEKKFFPGRTAVGERIKCGNQWLTIIGVTRAKIITEKAQNELGIRDYNMDIYTPVNTLLVRYEDRGLLKIDEGWDEEETPPSAPNYHQLDKLTLQMEESAMLSPAADVVRRYLHRRHNEVVDFEIVIPEQLLEQQQRTKDIFNLVLSAIAGISLLVGGIGIMNIMLASVLERTREIGTRLAIGAKKDDIIAQFLFEALLISLSGGLIGIALGVLGSYLIEWLAEIKTIISWVSILISFGVASATGLVFGLSPARKAALQDPVESLRYE